jgi:hypothetical protein
VWTEKGPKPQPRTTLSNALDTYRRTHNPEVAGSNPAPATVVSAGVLGGRRSPRAAIDVTSLHLNLVQRSADGSRADVDKRHRKTARRVLDEEVPDESLADVVGGRELAFTDIGAPDWPCVLFFHGAPSSRLPLAYLEEQFLAAD